MLKLYRPRVESLPYDVVELILERLPVEPLRRFRSVSKNWKSTIDSRCFQERQLNHRRQARGEDVLFVSVADYSCRSDYEAGKTRIVFGSSVISTVKFPFRSTQLCRGSCDGLLCLAHFETSNFVVNPATGWYRVFPHCSAQKLCLDMSNKGDDRGLNSNLGFGKDKVTGTYKAVFLCNSSEFGLDNITSCEVFDFGTNSWRYVSPASPYRTSDCTRPVYLDGSLHWFTECQDNTNVLSFHLHTETFQIIAKTPFRVHHVLGPNNMTMSILDHRLCVSEKIWPTQVVWLLDSSGTWEQICSIDLSESLLWFGTPESALVPVAILEKNKLLLHGHAYMDPLPLVIHDLYTKSYDLLYQPTTVGYNVSYFPSLFTVLLN